MNYNVITEKKVKKSIRKHFGKSKQEYNKYLEYFNILEDLLKENPYNQDETTAYYHYREDIGEYTVGRKTDDLRFIIKIDEEKKIVKLVYGGSHDKLKRYAKNEDEGYLIGVFNRIINK